MDIHECFEYKLDKLKQLVKDVENDNQMTEEFDSTWDKFERFLDDLVESDERFRTAITRVLFKDGEDLHRRLLNGFNAVDYEGDKSLVSLVYHDGFDKVTVDYNTVEQDVGL